MKTWTTQAEARLEEYLAERAQREGLQGEDAAELKDDMRRHIHEEAEQAPDVAIGLMHLENLLGKLDAGYHPSVAVGAEEPRSFRLWRGFSRFWAWTAGVVLPLGVLVFEMIAHFCGGVFFDPVPSVWHALLLAMVPGCNAWMLCGAPRGKDTTRGMASGMAIGIAGFYGLLFLPLIHLSVVALLWLGMGLLSLTPILAAIQTWRISRRIWKNLADPARFIRARRWGIAAAIAILVLLEAPGLWTRVNLNAAVSSNDPTPAAITRLRWFHSEKTLLKACYQGSRGTEFATDIAGWMMQSWMIPASMFNLARLQSLDSEKVREVFFRVTGKPFNSLNPPETRLGSGPFGRGDFLEDVEFDAHVGGDDVAVRVRGLDLAESRFDGHLDAVSQTGYGEWTMVFKNASAVQREARCQVLLPPHGRVSRLSLWVDGTPQEAAFNSVGKVKAAYRKVAVVQRQDPVLATMVGPDTVMIQCFPVPAQGEMKIRFGVTAPVTGGTWELPRIIERNFGTAGKLGHALWLQGDAAFKLAGSEQPQSSSTDGPGFSLSVSLKPEFVSSNGISVSLEKPTTPQETVWCEDNRAKPEERILIREPQMVTRPARPGKAIVVIDGSSSMASQRERILKSVNSTTQEETILLLADDSARKITPEELAAYRFTGGRDNEPALREAIRIAKSNGGGPIVWLHGPQAVKLAQGEELQQLMERGTVRPVIDECALVTGPNRLVEALYRSGCLRRIADPSCGEENLGRFLSKLREPMQEPGWQWRRAATADGLSGKKVWDHLARVWAIETAEDSTTSANDETRSTLAANYQLVTPLSGAVVLETQQQYADHGLVAGDPSASPQIPSIPEPSTMLLFILSITAAAMHRKRTV
ncbi:MAG: PEP-CTERM sorting domain-containing protein [Verrucomicrobiota bacterium]